MLLPFLTGRLHTTIYGPVRSLLLLGGSHSHTVPTLIPVYGCCYTHTLRHFCWPVTTILPIRRSLFLHHTLLTLATLPHRVPHSYDATRCCSIPDVLVDTRFLEFTFCTTFTTISRSLPGPLPLICSRFALRSAHVLHTTFTATRSIVRSHVVRYVHVTVPCICSYFTSTWIPRTALCLTRSAVLIPVDFRCSLLIVLRLRSALHVPFPTR